MPARSAAAMILKVATVVHGHEKLKDSFTAEDEHNSLRSQKDSFPRGRLSHVFLFFVSRETSSSGGDCGAG